MLPAWGGAFQPAPYKPSFRKFANPAPLGLCAFALTTFVLSLINASTRGVTSPSVVVGAAYAYGGFIQLLAGMWEMAVGNTFGATALSSYGGFWIAWALIETDGLGLISSYESKLDATHAVGFFLAGWFIFTFLCLLCTFKSTVAFFSLFFFLDITFLLLTVAHFTGGADGSVHPQITKAAGILGLITAFIAWWNAAAGMLESSNSFFTVPVMHFPWSEKVKSEKAARSD
ncbi:putative meiotically up-regulated gene 86 protein [Tricharina praecox]|uniref:putative meiotically up-regulated gene 86 protein n=1 Tax=Tricharina praecox TaxID=43433 RepID=UPI00221FCB48|nr:putative meiotically up-regulated gene 86 protein [Tricharina praecox]KAI5858722.1 putative meiotically up-regulated gene 86 protein [Tricharina praecox]